MCEFVGILGEQVALFNGAVDAEVALHVQALAEDAVAAAHLSQAAALHRRRDGRTAHVVSGRPSSAIDHAQPPGRTALSSSRGCVHPFIDR
jgi:ABC-type protease/lipase transport system fused ATPase/permease subunit